MKFLSTTLTLSLLTALTLAAPTPPRTTINTRQIACEEVQETPNGPWSVVCPVKRDPAVCEEIQETPNGPWSVVCMPSPHTKRDIVAWASGQVACEEAQETPYGLWSMVCPVNKRQSDEPAIEQESIAAGFAPPKNTKTGEKRSAPIDPWLSPSGCFLEESWTTGETFTVCSNLDPPSDDDDNTASPTSDEPSTEQQNISAGFAPPKNTTTGEKRGMPIEAVKIDGSYGGYKPVGGPFGKAPWSNYTSHPTTLTSMPTEVPTYAKRGMPLEVVTILGPAPTPEIPTYTKRGMPLHVVTILGPVPTTEATTEQD